MFSFLVLHCLVVDFTFKRLADNIGKKTGKIIEYATSARTIRC